MVWAFNYRRLLSTAISPLTLESDEQPMNPHSKLIFRRLFVGSFVAVVAAILALALTPDEPTYLGKPISDYLPGFSQDGYAIQKEPPFSMLIAFQPSPERTAAREAIDHAGSDAIPTLLEYAACRESKVMRTLKDWAEKVPLLNLKFESAGARRSQATFAFGQLGSRAESAVPELLPLLSDPDTAGSTILTLAFIRPGSAYAINALGEMLRGTNDYTKIVTMAALANIGPRARGVAPILSQQLVSTNDKVSAMAAVALARVGVGTPELATQIAGKLPQSSTSWRDSPAPSAEMYLWALGEMGTVAGHTTAVIEHYISDKPEAIKSVGKEAVIKIGRDSKSNTEPPPRAASSAAHQ